MPYRGGVWRGATVATCGVPALFAKILPKFDEIPEQISSSTMRSVLALPIDCTCIPGRRTQPGLPHAKPGLILQTGTSQRDVGL